MAEGLSDVLDSEMEYCFSHVQHDDFGSFSTLLFKNLFESCIGGTHRL